MKEYQLTITPQHMGALLESLRLHNTAVMTAPGSSATEKSIMADLLRRAELLNAVINAGDNLRETQAAYDRYIESSAAATVTVMKRPL